jgi:hypothetical protein
MDDAPEIQSKDSLPKISTPEMISVDSPANEEKTLTLPSIAETPANLTQSLVFLEKNKNSLDTLLETMQ